MNHNYNAYRQNMPAKAGRYDDPLEDISSPPDPKVVTKLGQITGLKASAVVFRGRKSFIKFSIPRGVDREKYVDAFIATRKAAGISKDDLPVVDGLGSEHDPTGFFIPADKVPSRNCDVVRCLQKNKHQFQALLSKPELRSKAGRGIGVAPQ
ncbi:MAG: hypothetical protein P4M13_09000 [Alphaproteobacteria bacterium]|nr:hypothetical protein [Alphaproteobacteria bacterium]